MEYPETHKSGTISIENKPDGLECAPGYTKGDFGMQIARDGRVWICINGVAFLRFSPHPNGKMIKEERFIPEKMQGDLEVKYGKTIS